VVSALSPVSITVWIDPGAPAGGEAAGTPSAKLSSVSGESTRYRTSYRRAADSGESAVGVVNVSVAAVSVAVARSPSTAPGTWQA
jgi:hypothetical protein